MNNNKRLAFCGIMTAVSIVLILILNVVEFNTLFILILMSLIISVIMEKYGALWAGMSFVATTLIMLFVTWKYDIVMEYFFIFGSFPVIKYVIENKRMKISKERLIKLGYMFVMSVIFTVAVIKLIGGEAYLGELYNATELMPYIMVVAIVIFWSAYDYILSFVINFYHKKFVK